MIPSSHELNRIWTGLRGFNVLHFSLVARAKFALLIYSFAPWMKLYSLPPLPDLPYAYSGGIELYFTYTSSIRLVVIHAVASSSVSLFSLCFDGSIYSSPHWRHSQTQNEALGRILLKNWGPSAWLMRSPEQSESSMSTSESAAGTRRNASLPAFPQAPSVSPGTELSKLLWSWWVLLFNGGKQAASQTTTIYGGGGRNDRDDGE